MPDQSYHSNTLMEVVDDTIGNEHTVNDLPCDRQILDCAQNSNIADTPAAVTYAREGNTPDTTLISTTAIATAAANTSAASSVVRPVG